MKTRTTVSILATAAAIVGCTFAIAQTPLASAAQATSSMSVDARTPLHATLLPTITVTASGLAETGASLSVADTAGLPVTLMPTVHVTARVSDFAALLPSVFAIAATDSAPAGEGVAYPLASDEDAVAARRR